MALRSACHLIGRKLESVYLLMIPTMLDLYRMGEGRKLLVRFAIQLVITSASA
jgi:hypothetical protein